MHRVLIPLDFAPNLIFQETYATWCLQALRQTFEGGMVEYMMDLIQKHLLSAFEAISDKDKTAADFHREGLAHRSDHWTFLRSNITCLSCLRRKPEYVLPCSHSICDACVRIFGASSFVAEYCFFLDSCVLCSRLANVTIHLKPPTAGVRILSIDGGGVRAMVPLETLALLQDMLGDLPVQDLFDLVFGTSSGESPYFL